MEDVINSLLYVISVTITFMGLNAIFKLHVMLKSVLPNLLHSSLLRKLARVQEISSELLATCQILFKIVVYQDG